jgi:hypothetical protein
VILLLKSKNTAEIHLIFSLHAARILSGFQKLNGVVFKLKHKCDLLVQRFVLVLIRQNKLFSARPIFVPDYCQGALEHAQGQKDPRPCLSITSSAASPVALQLLYAVSQILYPNQDTFC